jgi:hypothetical protein
MSTHKNPHDMVKSDLNNPTRKNFTPIISFNNCSIPCSTCDASISIVYCKSDWYIANTFTSFQKKARDVSNYAF